MGWCLTCRSPLPLPFCPFSRGADHPDASRNFPRSWTCRECRKPIYKGEDIVSRDGRKIR